LQLFEEPMKSETGLRTISVVVPVYNSSVVLPLLVKELEGVLPKCSVDFELILVNDASPDQSWQIITKLARERAWIHGINLMRNVGQHNAVLCGIRAAKYEIVTTMDDDLQNPPDEIPRLLAKLKEGFDVVYGTPEQEQHGIFRDLASKITKLVLQNAMGAEIARKISPFRVFGPRCVMLSSSTAVPSYPLMCFLPGGQLVSAR
jgi:undecaprenyl-phosphate 4-deoxy-4-formamido-L-arabinose transferase